VHRNQLLSYSDTTKAAPRQRQHLESQLGPSCNRRSCGHNLPPDGAEHYNLHDPALSPSNSKPPLACRIKLSLSRSPTHDHHHFLIYAVRLMSCKPARLRIMFSASSHRCCQTRNSVVNLGLRTETLSALDSFQGEGDVSRFPHSPRVKPLIVIAC
jgi:hypothetical protein